MPLLNSCKRKKARSLVHVSMYECACALHPGMWRRHHYVITTLWTLDLLLYSDIWFYLCVHASGMAVLISFSCRYCFCVYACHSINKGDIVTLSKSSRQNWRGKYTYPINVLCMKIKHSKRYWWNTHTYIHTILDKYSRT